MVLKCTLSIEIGIRLKSSEVKVEKLQCLFPLERKGDHNSSGVEGTIIVRGGPRTNKGFRVTR